MYELFNIPAHTTCMNCGECCGAIPVNHAELAEIRQYVTKHPEVRELAVRQSGWMLKCPFRDDVARRCTIYNVRPLICRLCGVTRGMECANGNSAEIDGNRFLKEHSFDEMVMLNYQNWKGE